MVTMDTTTIQVTKTFKDWLVAQGKYGDTHEQILIRLIGEDMYKHSGDRPTKVYTKEDTDTAKTKKMLAKRGEK